MTTIQLRRGTASEWTTLNPVLHVGEIGFEKDTNKHKIGDGVTTWSGLTYFVNETALSAFVSKWQAAKAYASGYITLSPDGKIIQRNTTGTSRSTYDTTEQAEWTVETGGVGSPGSPGPAGSAVVVYSGSLSTARPSTTFVVWEGFPSQPTNYVDGDLWLDPVADAALMSSAAAPTGTDGSDGDFWIKTGASPTLYGPKTSGSWGAGVSLVGPPGSPLTIQDQGASLATAATTINFTGAGVVSTGTGATKTILIPGNTALPPDPAVILGPSGTIRATANRMTAPMSAQSTVSGTLHLVGIALSAGDVISAANIRINSSYTSLTHAWAVLTNASRSVLAVSPDDTTGMFTGTSTKTWTFGSSYVVSTTGMYYVGIMIAGTGTIQAVTAGTTALSAPPIAAGASNTAQTTPPTVGTTMAAITAAGAPVPYIWLT